MKWNLASERVGSSYMSGGVLFVCLADVFLSRLQKKKKKMGEEFWWIRLSLRLRFRSAHAHQFHSVKQDQSKVAVWAKMTVA